MDKLFSTLPQNILNGIAIWILVVGVGVMIWHKAKGRTLNLYTTLLDIAVIGAVSLGGLGLLKILADGFNKMAGLD
ncbi:hypothetical protein [Thermoactinomyces sp. DSM 45892]|uniref:hypothetical protein n=1 Tax=Thermoactinomyces sp. DSM 45892 TaxID=1882753 RepID=UPI00089AE56A|nr:hypothetical protein [Thermoactinomyces sp. DSM 45892]SDY87598.1 hypothetical protein SAMN05444416_109140 [Thermoactinomyces sp. DSM 45892]